MTALHLAAENGSEPIVMILIEHGSNVNIRNAVLIFFFFNFDFLIMFFFDCWLSLGLGKMVFFLKLSLNIIVLGWENSP